MIDADPGKAAGLATEALNGFGGLFEDEFLARMRMKLGLATAQAGDLLLIQDLLSAMAQGEADFTLTFRALANGDAGRHFNDPALFEIWAQRWRARLADEGATVEGRRDKLNAANPWIIPRNHQIELVIASANTGDFAPFHVLADALQRPFEERATYAALTQPPLPHERVERTFCGT